MTTWQLFPATVFSEYAGQWDRLNEQLYQSHPMLDSRFVGALLDHFGNEKTLLAIYPSDTEQSGNFLLLQKRRLGIWSIFLPAQAQIAPVLCSAPNKMQELFKTLSGYTFFLDVLSQDPLYSFVPDSSLYFDTMHHATTMNISFEGTFEDYWQNRSKNLRKTVKRFFNRLTENSITINQVVNSSSADLEQAFERYGNLESKGWKGAEGTAIHKSNEQGVFYLDVIKAFHKTGQVEIFEVYFNDRLAASQIYLLNQSMLVLLKTTYDEEFARYAPGRVLCYLLLQSEFERKRAKTVEFYTNATADQLSWCTEQRNIEHLTIYRSQNIQSINRLLRGFKAKLIS